MKPTANEHGYREQLLAALLWYGTWLASAVIAVGMSWEAVHALVGSPVFGFSGHDIVKAGVALLILLPMARVALMLTLFLRERDDVYAAISAFVLFIIAAGIAIGFAH